MALSTSIPTSPLFEIRQTAHSGRAVFAAQDIPADTLIWRCDDLALSVLIRDYRREVCGECFGYEHGRDLRIREASVGFAFCSMGCWTLWKQRAGEVGVQAWTAVETLVRTRSKEDADMADVGLPRPGMGEIREAWEGVEVQAALIRIAREVERDAKAMNGVVQIGGSVMATKQHRRALQKALMQPISPEIMSFCLSGILWKHNNPQHWSRLLALADDDMPYLDSDNLIAFTSTYLHLLSILPLPLLPLVTPKTLFLLSSRDAHNAFGIRSLEDDGSEYFGYGCWPDASYFNHSCGPNVEKSRDGRVWCFRAGRDIRKGEELCITYLSGQERKLSREQRMNMLKENWGFDCACLRCVEP
ncbi:SET domain-containing protein [Lentithecium fluviatile CBS 122367]|uniref:SET domain-containing protein n=1 Tax=Lentithecium fluviatile CBS 122367 TaxID=1168545 RepID=A0A6G1ID64_9PLEO|nr:SET domain-containing protein [Lentithecium fluviatile CBS 122367]